MSSLPAVDRLFHVMGAHARADSRQARSVLPAKERKVADRLGERTGVEGHMHGGERLPAVSDARGQIEAVTLLGPNPRLKVAAAVTLHDHVRRALAVEQANL